MKTSPSNILRPIPLNVAVHWAPEADDLLPRTPDASFLDYVPGTRIPKMSYTKVGVDPKQHHTLRTKRPLTGHMVQPTYFAHLIVFMVYGPHVPYTLFGSKLDIYIYMYVYLCICKIMCIYIYIYICIPVLWFRCFFPDSHAAGSHPAGLGPSARGRTASLQALTQRIQIGILVIYTYICTYIHYIHHIHSVHACMHACIQTYIHVVDTRSLEGSPYYDFEKHVCTIGVLGLFLCVRGPCELRSALFVNIRDMDPISGLFNNHKYTQHMGVSESQGP